MKSEVIDVEVFSFVSQQRTRKLSSRIPVRPFSFLNNQDLIPCYVFTLPQPIVLSSFLSQYQLFLSQAVLRILCHFAASLITYY